MEVEMSKAQKTKKGVAAIYVVVFTTMLIGIITLSFLRIMLSESGRTLNDTLSDSAYNAALAGVEDAKYIISQYEKHRAAGDMSSDFVKAVEGAENTNCDIIPEALSKLDGTPLDPTSQEINIGTDKTFQDQAYTCVTINLAGDFKGTLSKNNPTLVVPLKPSGKTGNTVNDVKAVEVVWTMDSSELSGGTFSGNPVKALTGSKLNALVNNADAIGDASKTSSNRVLGTKGIKDNSKETALNGMRVMLVQSPEYGEVDYYAASGDYTNRGTLMLLASTDGVETIDAKQFVASADKTLNAPNPVKCDSESCYVKIGLPNPKGDTTNRNPNNFFLVLNQLYSEPGIKVTVNMLNAAGNRIDFFNVQPVIDATGRSGDLFRRVEARVGTDNGASLIPTAELSSNSAIDKSFYVTKNCINGTTECKK